MIESHFEVNTVVIKVNNQMVVIQVQVRKNNVEDVSLDGGTNVKTILGLPKPRPTPYHLKMADWNMIKPLGIIKNLKIHIHDIPYVATFSIL